MRVLGIDPAIATCGFALLERFDFGEHVRDLGAWECKAGVPLEERLAELRGDVLAYLRVEQPDVVIAETPTFMQHAQSYAMLWASFATIGACVAASTWPTAFIARATRDWRAGIGLRPVKAVMPKMPKHPRSGKTACACVECSATKKARRKAQAEAKKQRKASSTGLAIGRFPGAQKLLDATTDDRFHEHALEALCIAISWTDKATKTQTQGELAWQER